MSDVDRDEVVVVTAQGHDSPRLRGSVATDWAAAEQPVVAVPARGRLSVLPSFFLLLAEDGVNCRPLYFRNT